MPTYVKDLYRSSFTKGVRSLRNQRATIIGLVSGIGDGRENLEDACAAAQTARGPYHPDDTTLPLQTAHAICVGPDHAHVYLNYSRTQWDARGGVDSFTMPRLRSAMISVPHWVYYGTASGTAAGTADLNGWRREYQDQPVTIMRADFALTSSPYSAVFPLVGKANGGTNTYSGKTFPAHSIRFDSIDQEGRVVNGTAEFYVTYVFTINENGWIRYVIPGTGTVEGTQTFLGTANFTSAFPTS